MRKGNTMKFKELRQDVIHQVKSLKEYSLVDKKLPRIYCDMDESCVILNRMLKEQ